VLKGEMSLVGPRPHAVAHDKYYGECVSGYNLRFMAKPGITGLAQVSGLRGEITSIQNMSDRVALDIAYIGRWSFWLDVKILFWTIVSAPFDRSAY
jgi:putative colanic acid biosynthesis UDP-glucose lipid carrier transferase